MIRILNIQVIRKLSDFTNCDLLLYNFKYGLCKNLADFDGVLFKPGTRQNRCYLMVLS